MLCSCLCISCSSFPHQYFWKNWPQVFTYVPVDCFSRSLWTVLSFSHWAHQNKLRNKYSNSCYSRIVSPRTYHLFILCNQRSQHRKRIKNSKLGSKMENDRRIKAKKIEEWQMKKSEVKKKVEQVDWCTMWN